MTIFTCGFFAFTLSMMACRFAFICATGKSAQTIVRPELEHEDVDLSLQKPIESAPARPRSCRRSGRR